jgi:hypothetical protein
MEYIYKNYIIRPSPLQRVPVSLGNKQVIIERYSRPGNDTYLLHVHEDETTAYAAGKYIINTHGGIMRSIKHSGLRNITFRAEKNRYTINPNRIYSAAGRTQEISKSHKVSLLPMQLTASLADKILDQEFHDQFAVIALHNNADGADFNVYAYYKNPSSHEDIQDISINPKMHAGNFIIVNHPEIFKYLKEINISVILLKPAIQDDGSLSHYCSTKGIVYINIECRMEHLKEQIRMTEKAIEAIESLKIKNHKIAINQSIA